MTILSEELTLSQAAKKLRDMAELTAEYSRNWGNFEEIAKSMLTQAFEGGKKKGEADGDTERA